MVSHSELQPEAQATTSPGTRNTGESRAIGALFAYFEKCGGASEALVLRVAKPMSGLEIARAGEVQELLHSQGLPCVRGSNRWVYVRADVQAESFHIFTEALEHLTTDPTFERACGCRCQKTHPHIWVMGRDTTRSGFYPRAMGEAIARHWKCG